MKSGILISLILIIVSCHSPRALTGNSQIENDHQEKFWLVLQQHCGKAFEGTVISAPANDTTFRNKKLTIHLKECKENRIRIPFVVGDNRSRTFIFTKTAYQITLKHDHRHEDGTAESITMYGGATSNSGSATVQYFPADEHTAKILPAAAANVWWVELVAGKYLTYNLRRMGTDRLFTIRFDLSIPVVLPESPWGWTDQ
ncbi:MAG TPA: hypothetical protein VI548_08095 [Chitinophagaceae bacterium]|nr:hypothetical protein [Chitinophagaceae bacterium]